MRMAAAALFDLDHTALTSDTGMIWMRFQRWRGGGWARDRLGAVLDRPHADPGALDPIARGARCYGGRVSLFFEDALVLLRDGGVRFILVGGTAVILHGVPRRCRCPAPPTGGATP